MPLADYLTAPRRTAGFRQGLGPVRTPGGELRQWAHQVVEKVRVASVGGRLRFLPWYDPYTDETPEIRATYRIMLVDDAVKSAFLMKVLSVISQGVQFQPADDDNPRDRAVAQFCTYAFGKAKGGTPGLGWSIVAHGLIDGHSVCEPVWDDDTIPYGVWRGKRIFRAVKAKDTRYLQLGTDPYRNVTALRGTGFNGGRVWSPSDFSIFSHLPLFENPAGMSDFRAAYQPFWIKRTVWQLRSLHLENYTGPYLVGHYPKEDVAQKTALQDAFEEAKASTWLTIPVGAMIETIDLSMRGTEDFKNCIDDCNKAILVAIAGAHLQIMEGQVPGGRGNTKVQQGTAELAQWWLSESLATVYREQLVPLLVAENFHGVDTPQVSLGAVTEEAMLEMAKVDEAFQRLGGLLSKADAYKRYGRQQPVEADDILQPPGQGGGAGGASPAPSPAPPEGGDGGSSAFGEPEHDWAAMSESDWATFAAADWQPYTLTRGPNKGKAVWRNVKTGRISHEDPSAKEKERAEQASGRQKAKEAAAAKQKAAQAAREKARQAAVAAKAQAARQKQAAAAKQKQAQEKAIADVGDMIAGRQKATPAKVKAAGAVLLTLTADQLRGLKRQVGAVGGGGVKAGLVGAITERALGAGKGKAAAGKPGARAPGKTSLRPPAFTPGQPLTRRAINDRLKGLEDFERAAEVRKVMAEAAVDVGAVKIHGMADPEPMKGLQVDGVNVQWSEKAPGVQHSIAGMVGGMPEALWGANRQVVFAAQANEADGHWRAYYKEKGFDFKNSLATAGDGRVCVYNAHLEPAAFAHESGHNLAAALWGQMTPPPDSDYGRAQAAEPGVTFYGATNAAEDFAEACRMYATTRGGGNDRAALKKSFPKKYAAVEALLAGG
jgi:hypothetical protein